MPHFDQFILNDSMRSYDDVFYNIRQFPRSQNHFKRMRKIFQSPRSNSKKMNMNTDVKRL